MVIMKKKLKTFSAIFLFLLCPFVIYSTESFSYVGTYLENDNYKIKEIKICDKTMYLAATYNDSAKQIFDKAIIYELIGNTKEIIVHAKFSENKIESNNTVVFSSNIREKKFYGWKIDITEKTGFIHTTYYCDDGKNVTEGISLLWDSNKGAFKKYQVDRSQW